MEWISRIPALMTLVSEADPPGVEAKDVKLELGESCQHIALHTNGGDAIFIFVKLTILT